MSVYPPKLNNNYLRVKMHMYPSEQINWSSKERVRMCGMVIIPINYGEGGAELAAESSLVPRLFA